MGWLRRRESESLDPQYLLAQANATTPTAEGYGVGFRMTVQDVFSIKGRGTVVTGQIESGSVGVGDTVRQTRLDGTSREVTITSVEMFRKVVKTASAGDNVGLLLRDLGRSDIGAGDVLSR
jgi:elongation factor Tu